MARHLWQRGRTLALVAMMACLCSLTVMGFTWLAEQAQALFMAGFLHHGWWPWVVTPLGTAVLVGITRRWAPWAAGSGIPQVMAALRFHAGPSTPDQWAPGQQAALNELASPRTSAVKIKLTTLGMLLGLSSGREGPSVQIGAGLMRGVMPWLGLQSPAAQQGLLMAGAAAGIAATFNAPLGGMMFAFEQLSASVNAARPSLRHWAWIVVAACAATGMHWWVHGASPILNMASLGSTPSLTAGHVQAVLLIALACGLAGGLFVRLLLLCLAGSPAYWGYFWRARRQHPIWFAWLCGLAIAVVGMSSGGATFGSGYDTLNTLLGGQSEPPHYYTWLKLVSTALTAWSGVPAGLFAPSLAVGGSLGHDVAVWAGLPMSPAWVALGMAGFVAALTHAPLTAALIVMELTGASQAWLFLVACALAASQVSKRLAPPLYGTLAERLHSSP